MNQEKGKGKEWEANKADTFSSFSLTRGMSVKSRSWMFINLKIYLRI